MGNSSAAVATGTPETALAHAAGLLAQQPDLALDQAREILRLLPGLPQARLIEGQALRLTGNLKGSRTALLRLAADQPRSAATALELGLTAAALGERGLATTSLQRAVTLKPDWPAAWSELAAALRESGREAEAMRADLSAVQASTRDPLLIKAALALGDGRLEIAEPLLRDRLKRQPTDVAATRMLGELAWRLGRMDDALILLHRTVQLAPGFEAAREFLARLLGQTDRVTEALEQANILVANNPAHAAHAMFKASLLVRLGDQLGAGDIYEALLARHPDNPRTWMNLGHVRKTLGKQAEAVDAYRRAIALAPALGEAWWSLANLKTVKLGDADVAAMDTALANAVDTDEDRYHLHFALAKALEDLGQDEQAFRHYDAGNRLRRATLDYDAQHTHRAAQGHASLFTRGFLAARAGEGCPAPDPIFIVGLPRAGSTLIEQILASHSQVEGTMELPDMMMIAARLETRVDSGEFASIAALLAALTPDERARLGEEYIERTRVHRKSDKPLFIDKMPNNWQHVGLIRLILPQAKIIDARRHPMGCCFSGWKQHFARGQAFTYDLADLGRYYRDYVMQMAAFDEAAPGSVHRVIYEHMVADTAGEVARLLDYLGLPFEDACLAFWRNDRAVRTASSEQVRQPIFTDGVDHWKRFEPWLGALAENLGPVLASYPQAPSDRAWLEA
ncbi:MAG: sulfotransferase [Sphingobium sp.]